MALSTGMGMGMVLTMRMGMMLRMEMAARGEVSGQRWGKHHCVHQRKHAKRHHEKRLF
jgi:hypothetical protein